MLEKPAIKESLLKECLKKQYGLEKVSLEFLSIGNDVNTAIYKVLTNEFSHLYLKLRSGDFNKASVIVPHLLKESGIKQVIAPILTTSKKEWSILNEYSLALYPFIDGQNGFHHSLSDYQWVELGTAVKGLHKLHVPNYIVNRIPRENYSSTYRKEVEKLLHNIYQEKSVDKVAEQLSNTLQKNEEKINHMLKRAEELSKKLQNRQQDFVLCHADLHAANVLIDENNNLYIVDWDTVTLAPKEQDLMFIGAGIGGKWNKKEEEELFYKGYGKTEIDNNTITYYRYERFIQDIVEFSRRLLLTDEGGKDRENSLRKFTNAFSPKNVVDIAMREENFEFKK